MHDDIDWEQVAADQAEIIAGLSNLCAKCLQELSQYRSIDTEEKKLKSLSDDENH